MQPGDLVRFMKSNMKDPEWRIGILIEYQKWEKIARILYEGKVISMRPDLVQVYKRGNNLK
jgi:hypothetical protein